MVESDSIQILLSRGKGSKNKKTRTMASWAAKMIKKIRHGAANGTA
jgi:hypothetical protein